MRNSFRALANWVGLRLPHSCSSRLSGSLGDRWKMPCLSLYRAKGHVVLNDVLEHQHVPVGIFLLPEQGEGDRSSGIVYGTDQGEVRSSALQPVVLAPIYLQQHPLLAIALPSAAMPGSFPGTGTPDASASRIRLRVDRGSSIPSRSANISVMCV